MLDLLASDNFLAGILVSACGLYLLFAHRGFEDLLLRISEDARVRAETEPWPWWRWPLPTRRLIRHMSWGITGIALAFGFGSIAAALV